MAAVAAVNTESKSFSFLSHTHSLLEAMRTYLRRIRPTWGSLSALGARSVYSRTSSPWKSRLSPSSFCNKQSKLTQYVLPSPLNLHMETALRWIFFFCAEYSMIGSSLQIYLSRHLTCKGDDSSDRHADAHNSFFLAFL